MSNQAIERYSLVSFDYLYAVILYTGASTSVNFGIYNFVGPAREPILKHFNRILGNSEVKDEILLQCEVRYEYGRIKFIMSNAY